MKRRVAVTGMGIVCPIGNDLADVWESVKEGRCGIDKITKYDITGRKVTLAGEVKNLDIEKYIDPRELRKLDDFSAFAMVASTQAYEDAGLEALDESHDRWGVILSSGIGGIHTIEQEHSRGQKMGFDKVSPFFIPKTISNIAAGNIAIKYGLHGMTGCCVTACASAANGIGDAFRHIRDGYGDVMLAGGAEAAITELSMGGFTSMKALTKAADKDRASIPFDKDRSGFVMGEGSGVLVLEEYEHARARGAHIYAEIVGYGANCDAHHITAPDPEGTYAAKCMAMAIEDAGISPDQVDYINAHGTSTKMNDVGETKAIHACFGPHASELAVSSTKSMTGHLLGASAAVEAVITIKAIEEGFLPPTIGLKEPGEGCDLDYVMGQGRSTHIQYALSNSFGFGGHNGSLVFKHA